MAQPGSAAGLCHKKSHGGWRFKSSPLHYDSNSNRCVQCPWHHLLHSSPVVSLVAGTAAGAVQVSEHQTVIHGNIVLKDMVIVPMGLHMEAMAALYEKRSGLLAPAGVAPPKVVEPTGVETPPPMEVNPAQMKRQLATMMGVPDGFEPAGELKRRLDELLEAAQETPDGPPSEG